MFNMEVEVLHLHHLPESQTTGVLHCPIETSYVPHQDLPHLHRAHSDRDLG